MKIDQYPENRILVLIGIFLLALAFRLIRLDALTLSNQEAEIALQALSGVNRSHSLFGPHSAYVGLTALPFFLFSSTTFIARLWPAFVGSLVVFIPFLFKRQIGFWPALTGAIALAISPGMVGLSRQIGSPMMAMVFLLMAAGLYFQRRPVPAGISLALGLMSGPGFWSGLLILGFSVMIAELRFEISGLFAKDSNTDKPGFWLHLGTAFGITILVIGTGFFMMPAGLSGIFGGFSVFIRNVFSPTQVAPFILFPMTLLGYSTGFLVFGLWGGIRGLLIKDNMDRFLFLWVGIGLLFISIYPGRRVADLLWVVFPLIILSARVLYQTWQYPKTSRFITHITAIVVLLFSGFILLVLRTLINPILTRAEQVNHLIALIGAVVLLAAVLLVISYSWSEAYARSGLMIGLVIVVVAGMISVSVNSTSLGLGIPQTAWDEGQPVITPEWLQLTIDRVMVWNSRRFSPVDVAVSGFDTPAMHWQMRNYDPVYFVPFLVPTADHGILITETHEQPGIAEGYRGQRLVWSRQVDWQQISAQELLTWLIIREAPTRVDEVIIWVRTDLMPDDQFSN